VSLMHLAIACVFVVVVAGCSSGDERERGVAASRADGCARPYAPGSPWNAPIGASPRYAPDSAARVAGLGPILTSDPTQYTYPVYVVGGRTARRSLRVRGTWSAVDGGGRRLQLLGATTVRIPIPGGARAAAGSDAQAVIVDRRTGDEWGAWQLSRKAGRWHATNGYHYNIRWSGVPPRSAAGNAFGSRGAGVPYLAGLVRPCEIRRGRIDHALALASPNPNASYVPPATKSDGQSTGPRTLPQGARLQLDPSITRTRLRRWGCRGPCLTIARALQRYGMYLVDGSGRAKVLMEYEGTARWRGLVDQFTTRPIRMSALRVLELPDAG
jgi:hypothetical protein